MSFRIAPTASAVALVLFSASAFAQQFDVTVTIENLAPTNGTTQTPHWVGFHDGVAFDIYDSGSPASLLPIEGSVALERLAEDGNNAPITADFESLQPLGVQATIAGPNGPIAPGDVASMTFRLDASDERNAFFSYGSMILPSNDLFYANANPQAHRIFSDGEFVGQEFIVGNQSARDAGTEINDELEATTAFFSQAAPNTGTPENGDVVTIQNNPDRVRFTQGGRILSESRFSMADFTIPNYPFVKISFTAEPVDLNPPVVELIQGPARFLAGLNQNQTVPSAPVQTNAQGRAEYFLNNAGDKLRFAQIYRNLRKVTMAHLHLGNEGDTGPVVVDLISAAGDDISDFEGNTQAVARDLRGTITADDLVGPLSGQSLSALIQAIQNGEVYINIHTEQNPAGEIRGQL